MTDIRFPEPSGRSEYLVPTAAVDHVTYPPYRLIWCLEVFGKKDERLVAEIVLERFDVEALRRLLRKPRSAPIWAGGWPVTGKHRREIEILTGQKLQLRRYSYFIAASAVNYHEVNQRK